MLSLEKCRRYLDDESLSDEQIEAIRADYYETLQLAFDVWWHEKGRFQKSR